MFTRKLATGNMTSISWSAIFCSKIAVPVRLPSIDTPILTPDISRYYYSNECSTSMKETVARNQATIKEAEIGEKTKEGSRVKGKEEGQGVTIKVPERSKASEETEKKSKTIAELDEELRAKMEGREGAAGVSYKGGKPVTDGFGRGVKSNMFRII